MSDTYIVFGLPGVGKSTVLNKVTENHDVATFDVDNHLPNDLKDDIKDGKLVDKDRWASFHDAFLKDVRSADHKTKLVTTNLILDDDRHAAQTILPEATWIHLHVPKKELRKRLKARDDHFFNPDIFDDLHRMHQGIDHDHVEIDASQPPGTVIEEFKKIIV